ncbi:MAG: alkaline phosphatase family protein [bacterium]
MRFLAVLATIVLTAPRPPAGAQDGSLRHVIIMSFDGLRPDALRQVMPAGLLSRAAYSWTAQTTLPSSTLPAHTSMLTGVGTEVHRVRFNDRARGYVTIPTVFSVMTAQGKGAAAFVNKPKLLYLVRPGTVTRAEFLSFPAHRQEQVAREAVRYLAQAQPHLLFIHVADPDDAGHSSGWMSAPYIDMVRQVPATIEIVLDVLTRMSAMDQSLLIITADHGGHGRTHGSADPRDMTIPWLAFGAVRPGPIPLQIKTYDTAATALAALGIPIPSTWQGKPVVPVGRRHQVR